jgi:hypothetical protein
MGFIYFRSSPFTIDFLTHVTSLLKDAEQQQKIFQQQKTLQQVKQQQIDETNIADNDDALPSVANRTERIKPDDQWAVNHQLFLWNITWGNGNGTELMEVENSFSADIGTVDRRTKNSTTKTSAGSIGKIVLLPNNRFTRQCFNSSENWKMRSTKVLKSVENLLINSTIVHCQVSSGNSRDKKYFLMIYRLWAIPGSIQHLDHPMYGMPGGRLVAKEFENNFSTVLPTVKDLILKRLARIKREEENEKKKLAKMLRHEQRMLNSTTRFIIKHF